MTRGNCFFICIFLCLGISGCGSLLPVAKKRTETPWRNFDQAKASLDQVVPYQSTRQDLVALALDP